MKKLPKTVPAHTPVAYRLNNEVLFGTHTPNCKRTATRLQVTAGYDDDAQAFTYRWVRVTQILGFRTKPEEAADFATPEETVTERIKRRYPKNFQKRLSLKGITLDEVRDVEFGMSKRELRKWLNQSAKNRNNSPTAPKGFAPSVPKVKRVARRTTKKYHKAVSVTALIKSR